MCACGARLRRSGLPIEDGLDFLTQVVVGAQKYGVRAQRRVRKLPGALGDGVKSRRSENQAKVLVAIRSALQWHRALQHRRGPRTIHAELKRFALEAHKVLPQ